MGKPSLTADLAAIQITRNSDGWADAVGQSTTVSWAFRNPEYGDAPSPAQGASPLYFPGDQEMVVAALRAWADVANIQFDRRQDPGPDGLSNDATILLAAYSSNDDGAQRGGFAYRPGSRSAGSADGDVWIHGDSLTPGHGAFGPKLLLHEIGHAIGLSHPGEYNVDPDLPDPTYATDAIYRQDSRQYTVMSYFSATNTGADHGGEYAASPLMHDIAAAQRLYGANSGVLSGDTAYGFYSNTGRDWYSTDTFSKNRLIFCAWDTGGTDTFNFSEYDADQRIDLRAGKFSDVGGLKGNVSIFTGVTIENAKGGQGADLITGNSAANVLEGFQDNDTIYGGSGTDTIGGDDGNDTLYGSNSGDSVTGGYGDDRIFGGLSADRLDGGYGGDIDDEEDGNDIVKGEDGNDWIRASAGNDVYDGGAGSDMVTFEDSNVAGLAVNLRLASAQAVGGPFGNNTFLSIENLIGSEKADVLLGGTGANLIWGRGGDDMLSGGRDTDKLYGEVGDDLLYGDEGHDTLTGGDGNDVLFGDDSPHGVMTLLSETALGVQGIGVAQSPAFSPNGQLVAFYSNASNLDGGFGTYHVFVKNLATGAITRASGDAAGTGFGGGGGHTFDNNISFAADNQRLLFTSDAGDLGPTDTNSLNDIYIRNIATGETTLVSTDAAGGQTNNTSFNAVFSPDSTKVAFISVASNLVANDTNSSTDVFVKDLASGAIERVSTGALGGEGNGRSWGAVFSPDGTRVAFASEASNFVGGDDNEQWDVFVKTLATGAIQLVSTDIFGHVVHGGNSGFHGLANRQAIAWSPDGNSLAFVSGATDLIDNDTNNTQDIFIKNLATGGIARVSNGAQEANGPSLSVAFSPDGRAIAFTSQSSHLVAGDTLGFDLFVKDLFTGDVARISQSAAGVTGNNDSASSGGFAFNGNGTAIVFDSFASNLVAGDTNDVPDTFLAPMPILGGSNDTLVGGNGNDDLHGGFGADLVLGGAGNDTLDGGSGADTLNGGSGNDIFRFYSTDDSPPAAPDRIMGFSTKDRIDLAAIDADPFQAGDQAFTRVASFTGQSGEAVMTYDVPSNQTRLMLDVNGTGFPDATILIDGNYLTYSNFVL